MLTFSKALMALVLLAFAIGSCKRHDDLFAGQPLATHLVGTWILDRIETPTRTLTAFQLGSAEKFVHRNGNGEDVDSIFHNDTLYARYVCVRNPATISSKKHKTVLQSYRGGLKRFFKIIRQSGKPDRLEASDYLPEIGTSRDTVKFFYTNARTP